MSDINITINGTKRLLTAGKYCDKNIVITSVGGGDFSGEYVIPVDELPTENIDTNAVYLCKGAYYKGGTAELVDVMVNGVSLGANFGNAFSSYTYYYATTKPTQPMETVFSSGCHIYYVKDENDLFWFIDFEGTGEASWYSLSYSTDATFDGVINDASEATTSNYYAVVKNGWTKYLAPTGTLEITESGTYDVSEYASAEVNVAVPMEVETEAEMTALLETAEIGSVYKYIGANGTYETDALYVVEESE